MAPRDRRGDEDLVRRARGGDQAAFLELYDRHAPDVYAYLRLILSDREGAGLATEDVFERALKALPAYERPTFPVRIWLLWLAHEAAGPSKRALPIASTGSKESPASIVSKLPQGPREAFVLRHLLGLSVSEAAVVMGQSPGAICALERRALEALDRLLEPDAKRAPLRPQRLGLRARLRESPVAMRRRWVLAPR